MNSWEKFHIFVKSIVLRCVRVNFFKSDRSVSGQNLDHLHTIAIQTGLVHIKTGLNIFGLGRTYMATGWIIDFGPRELNSHLLTMKIAFQKKPNFSP